VRALVASQLAAAAGPGTGTGGDEAATAAAAACHSSHQPLQASGGRLCVRAAPRSRAHSSRAGPLRRWLTARIW
jgi:hypothetical protein